MNKRNFDYDCGFNAGEAERTTLQSRFDRATAERDALQQLLNASDQQVDDAATENNERELSRRDWFDEVQRLEGELTKSCEEVRLLKHNLASYLETMGRTCDLLGIDLDNAKSAEGKPSDVLFQHAKVLREKLAERDALLREAHEELICRDSPVARRIAAALSASAEPEYPRVQKVRAHKHTCANVQPWSTCADICDCGAVVNGVAVAAERDERAEFKREDRYIVIKRSDLARTTVYKQVDLELALESLSGELPARECLVIESDWPEYEPAWAAIEARAALERKPAECVHEFIPFTKGCSKCGEPYKAEGASHE